MSRRSFLFVVGVALLVRLLHVFDLHGNPFFNHPVIDAADYDEWARAIRHGDLLAREQGTFRQPPLYSYFLATLYFLFGGGYLAARLVQAALGALSAGFVAWIGDRLAGRRVGLAAGLVAALYWPFIYFDGELLPATLHIFLDLTTVVLLLRASRTTGPRPWLLAGVPFALAVLTRPTSIILLPLILLWLLGERGVPRLRSAALFALPLVLLVGLVTWRNYAVGGEPVLISPNGGINFYIGNNGEYDRTIEIRPGSRWSLLLLEGPVGDDVTPKDRSMAFFGMGLRWIGSHPLDAAALYLKKLYLFWNAHEIRRNQDPYFFRRYSHFLGPPLIGFAVVGPLALAGLVLSLRAWRRYRLLFLLAAGHTVSVILFFVCARYRIPAVPYLILFAAIGVGEMIGAARAARRSVLALGVAVWAVGLTVAMTDAYGTAHPSFAREHYELGMISEKEGEWRAAEGHFRDAIEIDPDDPDLYVQLAVVQIETTRYAEAEATLQQALAVEPRCGPAFQLLGSLYEERGEYLRAADAYRRALQYDPLTNLAEVYARLATALTRAGELGQAEEAARHALEANEDHIPARLLLAHALSKTGRMEEAIREAREVLRRDPNNRAARDFISQTTGGGSAPREGTP